MAFLELHDICKTFSGGVRANHGISLQIDAGEIRGLVGENGAGKSTLMKILYGMEQPDRGEIRLNGQRVSIPNPHAAIALGIGMVHQHFQLVPSFTAAENVVLGSEPGRSGGRLDRAQMNARVAALSQQYGLEIAPEARVSELSVGMQQRVEILKMLYRSARVLIFDEPSAVLTPQEVDSLFEVVRRLVAGGCTAIFITHKLYEIMTLCQRATVLRRGEVVGTVEVASSSAAEIARLMIGAEVVAARVGAPPPAEAPPCLTLRELCLPGPGGRLRLDHVSLEVRRGEIVGVAGVEGNGQAELVQAITGVGAGVTGEVSLEGTPLLHGRAGRSVRARREAGLAVIPEDRNLEGLSPPQRLWENTAASAYYRPPGSRLGWLNRGALRARARALIAGYDIRTPDENALIRQLSGGNAQKVVIAREIDQQPRALIAAQPTRGLDVGAARFVHEQLLRLRAEGVGILLISADLDEVLAMSDRIAVMFEGRIIAVLPREAAQRERLGLLMSGRQAAAS